ncbi:AT hook motif DNA-binding family protein [Artemisia annua]|uniref:AT-hook motif nuclear-localized protein n=1 Tax=Artemisia annua TaxID=35608 RepID=A0A2U1MJR6_ARTAN|nr:AT hook motif DNA-binding family protein [Artemisia annua]
MDGRSEEMKKSYYLNKSGSSNQRDVGGPHIPTPGLKIGPNIHTMRKRGRPRKIVPNVSSNMELALVPVPVSGLSLHSPSPPKKRGRPSGSGWKQRLANVGMRKRGRPRKIVPNVSSNMELALVPVPVSGLSLHSPSPPKKRGRPSGSGWKQRLANVGEWMNNSAGLAFTPHIIHVSVGEDVAEKILSFAKQRPRALCILSGNGTVSAVTLSQFSSSGGTLTYEGRFEILRLSGSYLLSEHGGPHNRTGGLSISACSGDGKVFGGAIGGRLVASSPVQVMVCSFVYNSNNVKVDNKTEAPSTAEKQFFTQKKTDEKRLDIQLNEEFNPIAVPWERESQTGLKHSPTEIDLSRG